MQPVEVISGNAPIILGMPHTGTYVPPEIRMCLNEVGKGLSDTDWNIHKLYEGLLPDVTIVRATFHRYVIDANRDPSGATLYPAQNTTALVPETDFEGQYIWREMPTAAAVEYHKGQYHAAYHAALQAELDRVRDLHSVVILYDCHSIRSRIPFLFNGLLPDFNIGTNDGVTCAQIIAQTVEDICRAASTFTTTVNGRFKGGWTTRHYGRPEQGIHAIQMELAQSTYMEEAPPWPYLHDRAEAVRAPLKTILTRLDALVRDGALP